MEEILDRMTRVTTMLFSRYLVISGVAFLVWYVIFKKKWSFKKIQMAFPKRKDYQRELLYSVLTVLVFAIIAAISMSPWVKPYSMLYKDLEAYPMWYYILSFPLVILIHDTYFYWTHRFMHHPRVFKWVHLVHHRSTNPSPWAAYAFHPLESVLEGMAFFVIFFTVPVHISVMLVFLLFNFLHNVYGHLGYELMPKALNNTKIGRLVNTSVYHNLHHKYCKGNYGLYFTFWDKWMGTYHEKNLGTFDEVKLRVKQ
ncbi:sterol desaturase family protein [Limibacter armeniacum]|uniref:sterol desaturase family protein n=1 Tax=Limibacter armeniacum TaxID=466084 RepID=UPI002FE5076E